MLTLNTQQLDHLDHLDGGLYGLSGDEAREGGHPVPGQVLLVVSHQLPIPRLVGFQQRISLQINDLLQMKAAAQLKLFHILENISKLSSKYLQLTLKCFAFYKNTPRQDWCRHI